MNDSIQQPTTTSNLDRAIHHLATEREHARTAAGVAASVIGSCAAAVCYVYFRPFLEAVREHHPALAALKNVWVEAFSVIVAIALPFAISVAVCSWAAVLYVRARRLSWARNIAAKFQVEAALLEELTEGWE